MDTYILSCNGKAITRYYTSSEKARERGYHLLDMYNQYYKKDYKWIDCRVMRERNQGTLQKLHNMKKK
jgi:hypothetical protein